NGNYLYATSQSGNHINKVNLWDTNNLYNDSVITLDGSNPPYITSSGSYDPHQIQFTPDESEYFVSCQTSNEVRIFRASNDSLIKVIKVGKKPQEIEDSDK